MYALLTHMDCVAWKCRAVGGSLARSVIWALVGRADSPWPSHALRILARFVRGGCFCMSGTMAAAGSTDAGIPQNDQAAPASQAQTSQAYQPTIFLTEWTAAVEDYGIYYAQAKGYYSNIGVGVVCNNMLSSEAVVRELKDGRALFAAVSSATALEAWRSGAKILKIIPLVKYNPTVALVRKDGRFSEVKQLNGQVVGVTLESPSGRMWRNAQRTTGVRVTDDSTVYVPRGGVKQLLSAEVSAVIGSLTQISVGIEYPESAFASLWLQDVGVKSFGRVLVVVSPPTLGADGRAMVSSDAIAAETCRGYENGGVDAQGAADVMVGVRKYFKKEGVVAAIGQIVSNNERRAVRRDELDVWLVSSATEASRLSEYHALYSGCR